MKSVLISIHPKWCEKIANGEKTIEVRKNRPKLETPFKCYIYCTKPKYEHEDFIRTDYPKPQFYGGGKVIGEFACDRIYNIDKDSVDFIFTSDPGGYVVYKKAAEDHCGLRAAMTDDELHSYLGHFQGYGWHISDLKIYDTPLELGEFWAYNEVLHKRYDAETDFCCYDSTNEYGEALTDCGDAYLDIRNCYRCWNEWSGWCHRVNRPPQSWCYVEEQT